MKSATPPKNIDAYIATFPADVRAILEKIRATIHNSAPGGEEVISYGMPAVKLNGRILVYFAAFKNHIGLFPPAKGDEAFMKEIAPYAGPKGNLKFPLDEPIPYPLIRKVVKLRIRENAEKADAATARKNRRPKSRDRPVPQPTP